MQGLANLLSFISQTYCLKKVVKILDKHKESLTYKVRIHPLSSSLYPDGCIVSFTNSNWGLSIQTAPVVAGDSMCESALIWSGKLVMIDELNYDQTLRHYSSKTFANHIEQLIKNIENKTIEDFKLAKIVLQE